MDPWKYLTCEDPVDQVVQDAVIKLAVEERDEVAWAQMQALARAVWGG